MPLPDPAIHPRRERAVDDRRGRALRWHDRCTLPLATDLPDVPIVTRISDRKIVGYTVGPKC